MNFIDFVNNTILTSTRFMLNKIELSDTLSQ